MSKLMLAPAEIAEYTMNAGIKKANTPASKVLASSFLAGAYIALGALGSLAASYNLLANSATYGLGKAVAALMFPVGLMFILIAGADLFTGNILITIAALKKKVSWSKALINWTLVWIGNLVGGIFVAYLVNMSGVFEWSSGLYGGVVISNTISKVSHTWPQLLASGILCNWIVCATVWISYGSKDIAGKVLTIFFGIFLFICAGFEHSVANMGYLFGGFFAKSNPEFLEAIHKTATDASSINLSNIFMNNLVPVTIGNIIGGAVFVAGMYYFLYLKDNQEV